METVESCGRTLLDTINSVLDYSKINAFERDSKFSQKPKRSADRASEGVHQTAQMLSATLQSGVTPSNGLVVPVDLGVLCEEVCDGTLTGFVFSGFSPDTILQKDAVSEGAPYSSESISPNASSLGRSATQPTTVVLNIDPGDWQFYAEPGASMCTVFVRNQQSANLP
jgi:hypothetical protein